MKIVMAIAFGGAAGAVSRHYLANWIMNLTSSDFPYGILVANILGSLLMGVLVTLFALKIQVSPEMKALLTVGFLGAFTTFSTYSMQTVMLVERGAYMDAALYMAGSVVLGIAGFVAGMQIGKLV